MAAQETLLNGRYRLLSQQGSGGMAVVYKAQDLQLGRTVAIKVLRPSLTGDPSFLTRFRQEARNVANLTHPNIVTLHDVGQDGNTYYMVMEYIDGQDLKKIIRASAPFTVDRALHIGIQICAGIGYAHRAGLIHADVKPQNILVTGPDVVKITDFGIAQALSLTQPQEKQSVVWGSPHYFSPEQATGEPPTPASDVYAIGIVIFEMLTGKLPYSGSDQQELALAHIREQVPHTMDLNPNVPVHLDRIIYKVMSKEPAARYRTADQLGRILIEYQKQGQDLTANVANLPPMPVPGNAGFQAPKNQPPMTQSSPMPQSASQPQSGGAPFGGYPTLGSQPGSRQPYFSGNTPPPQSPQAVSPNAGGYSNAPRPATGPAGRAGVSSPSPINPMAGPYTPPGGQPPMQGQTPGQAASSPDYRLGAAPPQFDMISVALGFVAFVAVVGLLILWLAVYSAWR
jgi:serine/threonine-protein kinase